MFVVDCVAGFVFVCLLVLRRCLWLRRFVGFTWLILWGLDDLCSCRLLGVVYCGWLCDCLCMVVFYLVAVCWFGCFGCGLFGLVAGAMLFCFDFADCWFGAAC